MTEEDHGWLLGFLHIDGPNGEIIEVHRASPSCTAGNAPILTSTRVAQRVRRFARQASARSPRNVTPPGACTERPSK